MRIIGGELRGKMIIPPVGFDARPTTDFAKEGLFNILNNRIDFSNCSVLDLFSGTGSISYEFASRGCPQIYSIEMNPLHASYIKRNTAKLGLKSIQTVHHNVFDFIEICKINFDVIFADPPYDIDGLESIPDKVLSHNLLKKDGILILEHPAKYSFENHPRFIKEKKYGNVHFTFFE